MNWSKRNTKRANEEFEDMNSMAGSPVYLNLNGPSGNDFQAPSLGSIRVVENHIYFYGDVDEQNALILNTVLHESDLKAQNTKNILGDEYEPVVHLHLSTYGGGIYAGLSTVDTISRMKSKVYTYIEGAVASAGTFISCVGHKRFIGPYAHILIHQLSGGMYGKYSEMEEEMGNFTKLHKLLKNFYKKNSKLPMKKLDELLARDLWLSPEEAIEFGLADEIK